VKDSKVTGRCLIVPGCDRTVAFEIVEEAFNSVPNSIEAAIKARRLLATRMWMKHRRHSKGPSRPANPVTVVPAVAYDRLALCVNEQFLSYRSLVLLSRGDFEVERLTARRCDGVNFC
jgi:hypothetical protein